jgi:hypothetical protein
MQAYYYCCYYYYYYYIIGHWAVGLARRESLTLLLSVTA